MNIFIVLLGVFQFSIATNLNSTFYGHLEIPNGTNSTNITNLNYGDNIQCSVMYADHSSNSKIKDIIHPQANEEIYYPIGNQTCLNFDIDKSLNLFVEFRIKSDAYNPDTQYGFEIYHLNNPEKYHISYTRIQPELKTFVDFAEIPSYSNFTIGLWLRFIEGRTEFGYKGSDKPIKTFYFIPEYFIATASFYDSAIYVIKESNCSDVKSESQNLITKCWKSTSNSGENNDSDHDHDHNHNETISDLMPLLEKQNNSMSIMLSDIQSGLRAIDYLTKEFILEFINEVKENYANAKENHITILSFLPGSYLDSYLKGRYIEDNVFIRIRQYYFELFGKAQQYLEHLNGNKTILSN